MRTEKKPSGSDAGWDAIVIGSGMGGLSAAAALSRTGYQVLLLEQYQTLGGLTHSFARNGFSWDVGLHYLSGVAPGEPERKLLDWLCDSPIDLAPIGTIYDVLHIGSTDPLLLSRPCEDIQDLTILIHGAIQITQLSVDTHEDFVDEPLIAAGTGSFT